MERVKCKEYSSRDHSTSIIYKTDEGRRIKAKLKLDMLLVVLEVIGLCVKLCWIQEEIKQILRIMLLVLWLCKTTKFNTENGKKTLNVLENKIKKQNELRPPTRVAFWK